LTSVAAQDDVKLFINQGTTKRRKDVSRFLDLDIFDRMYELAKIDVNANKGALKQLPDRDWHSLEKGFKAALADKEARVRECDNVLHDATLQLHDVQQQLAVFKDFNPVTQTQVDQHRSWVTSLSSESREVASALTDLRAQIDDRTARLSRLNDVLKENDIEHLKRRLESFRALEASLKALRLTYEKDVGVLKQQERSLKILDDVPCGDSFPGCRFIKDAFKQKDKVGPQRERADRSLDRVKKAQQEIDALKGDDISGQVDKLERLIGLRSTLTNELVRLESQRDKKEREVHAAVDRLEVEKRRLSELEEALRNEENVEAVFLRNKLDDLQKSIKRMTVTRLALASEVGKIQAEHAHAEVDRSRRQELLQLMKAHELIAHGFSRKGIPSLIVASQLPIINAEVAKILSGIVDFSIELEQDDDSDSLEIYIDYGDSRRIIELASGMEKTIASIAIRVALINVTSLPKTDIFIIDEAFGPLDPVGVEACNRLLISLKRFFRAIVVITHVEGVKDVADHIIEVSRVENDAHVVYDGTCHSVRTTREG
jgi:DNA repair exonuclease SbcCD ATPase subunit